MEPYLKRLLRSRRSWRIKHMSECSENSFLRRCEQVGDIYCALLLTPDICGVEADQWESLKFLLKGYAFERQGRSDDYAPVAAHAIDSVRNRGGKSGLNAHSAADVWRVFRDELSGLGIGLNHAVCPLCPQGERYTRHYKGKIKESQTWQESIVDIAHAQLGGLSLLAWARNMLKAERVSAAHTILRQANGVSWKLASFFLRDIAVMYGLAPSTDRWLLQPVDVWVRLVVQRCAGDANLSDTECANYITESASQPEKANPRHVVLLRTHCRIVTS